MASDMYGTVLQDVNSTARPIDAPGGSQATSTVLSSLAEGLNSFSRRWQNEAVSRRQAAADARAAQDQQWQAQDRANKQEGQAVAGDVTRGVAAVNSPGGLGDMFDVSSPAPTYQQPAEDPRVTADVQTAAAQINRTSLAVDQGKLPAMSKTAQIDTLFNRLLVKYPDRVADIAAQFKALGVDSALFDELKNETDQRTAAMKAQQDEQTKAINFAREHLDPTTTASMSPEELAAQGYSLMAKSNQLDLTLKSAQIQGQINSNNQSAYNFTKQTAADRYFNDSTQLAITSLQPIAKSMQQILLQLGEPGANPELETQYSELLTRAKTAANNVVNNLVARGGFPSADAANQARQALMNYVQGTLIQPYEDRNKDFASASQAFTTFMGLDAKVSAPVIYDLKTKFGIRPSDIPGLIQALPPDIMNGVRSELQGIAKPGVNQNIATIHLSNILATLKGEKSLQGIDDPQQRRQVVAGNWQYVLNNGSAIARGQGNANMWMNGVRTLVVASEGFNPATPPGTINAASKAMFSTGTVGAIDRLISQPDTRDEVTILTQGLRASAALALTATKRQIGGQKVPGYRIAVDSQGKYQIIKDPTWKVNALPTTYVAGVGVMPSNSGARPPVPSSVQQMVDTANRAQDFLIITGKYDPEAPKGSPKELRRHYSLGEPLPGDSKGGAASTASVEQMIQQVRTDLSNVPNLLEGPSAGTSRGERNNNAGNIKDGSFAKSQPGYTGSDGTFATFATPEAGVAAQEKLLSSNYLSKGVNTVSKIVNKYLGAGDSENSPQSRQNYITYVSNKLGVNPNDTLSTTIVGRLAEAMREFETGNTGSA